MNSSLTTALTSRRGARRPVARLLAAIALLVLALPALPAAASAADAAGATNVAGTYTLGPLDKLKIRISEWQTAEATFRDWSSVSGDYSVGPDGKISIPFAGSIKASGRTTDELATTIGDRLQQDLGLIDRPSASVEIVQYRPVFVTGDVQTAGQYPYQPGLTVLKAISLAGGLRHEQSSGGRPERNFINAKGNYDVLVTRRDQLLAEKARLKAEAAGKSSVDMPSDLKGAPDADKLMANQNDILSVDTRNKTLKLQALKDLKDLLHSEIESLKKKGDTQEKQLQLMQKQLGGIGNLASKGLVVNSRVLNLQAQIADLRSRLLDLDTTRLQARQDMNKADQDQIKFENDRDSQRTKQLQDANEQLREITRKLSMNRDLMLEAVLQSASAPGSGPASLPETGYTIVRTAKDGSTKTIKATEGTRVLPGDVIKTTVQLPTARDG